MKYSEFHTLREALDFHSEWLRFGKNGEKVDFSGADLSGANLSSTDVSRANFSNANLSNANLSKADLSFTDLGNANLSGTNLNGTNFSGANVRGANLIGANLENGLSWERYLSEVVPALCIAGEKSLEEVAAVWNCHSWKNCPMHVAFGVNLLREIPKLYRLEAERFIFLFDQGLIPNPITTLGTQ